jgi:hypothetical protein
VQRHIPVTSISHGGTGASTRATSNTLCIHVASKPTIWQPQVADQVAATCFVKAHRYAVWAKPIDVVEAFRLCRFTLLCTGQSPDADGQDPPGCGGCAEQSDIAVLPTP